MTDGKTKEGRRIRNMKMTLYYLRLLLGRHYAKIDEYGRQMSTGKLKAWWLAMARRLLGGTVMEIGGNRSQGRAHLN